MTTPLVCTPITLSSACMSRWNSRPAAARTTLPPALSMNTAYSGKQGVTTTNSSPSSHRAFSVIVSDAAAPQVMYTPSADMGTPNAVRI